jgi:hypothetical protein
MREKGDLSSIWNESERLDEGDGGWIVIIRGALPNE